MNCNLYYHFNCVFFGEHSSNYLYAAIALARHVIFGTTPDEAIRRYRAVTPADIQRVARALLTQKNCSVLYYEKKER